MPDRGMTMLRFAKRKPTLSFPSDRPTVRRVHLSRALVVLALALAAMLPTPAAAPTAAAPSAKISAVWVHSYEYRTDDSGFFCEYRANVTMSWKRSQRLQVSQTVGGIRREPGEFALTGTGTNVTLVVSRIYAVAGASAPLVAEAWVFSTEAPVLLSRKATALPVTCSPP